MSDLPPPPAPPPPPPGGNEPPPGYVAYGQHQPVGHGTYAGFWIRFLAALVDGLLIGVPMAILGNVVGAFDSTSTDAFGNTTESTEVRFVSFGWTAGAPAWFNVLNTVVGVLYYGLLEGGPTGQTLGKRICNVRVVDANTGQAGIGIGRAIGRYFARILSAIPLLLGYFWMLWDDRKQTWHDKLVSSVVIRG